MNIGGCPYPGCSGTLMLETPDRTPAYALIECDECGGEIWYRFSRLDPEAWTKADFDAEHVIDYEAGTVVKKDSG